MTISEAISRIDAIKSNAYGRNSKVYWLSVLDGRIKKKLLIHMKMQRAWNSVDIVIAHHIIPYFLFLHLMMIYIKSGWNRVLIMQTENTVNITIVLLRLMMHMRRMSDITTERICRMERNLFSFKEEICDILC